MLASKINLILRITVEVGFMNGDKSKNVGENKLNETKLNMTIICIGYRITVRIRMWIKMRTAMRTNLKVRTIIGVRTKIIRYTFKIFYVRNVNHM